MSGMALPMAAWLLTYALHSTLLLCAAALLARHVRGEAWRETLWKAALIGGLLTATAQSVSGYRPPVGRWTLAPAVELSAEIAADPAAAPAVQTPGEAAPRTASPASASSEASTAGTQTPAQQTASPESTDTAVSFSLRPLAVFAVVGWMLIAALLMVRIAWRQTRLWRMLRGRAEVADAAVLGMMAGLRRNAGIWRPVRLTVCAAAPTPLALGGGEICVPPRFLTDLDDEQQRSALAHELAHLARRDAAWHFAVGVLEALFFFQPLNRVARLRLRESAEFLADEWAARHTGSPLGLARCLAEVASWVAPGGSPIPAGTLAMAEGGSPLVQRVQRLTTWRGGAQPGSGVMRTAGGAMLVLAVAFAAPAVASSGSRNEPAADPLETDRTQAVEDGVRGGVDAQDGIIRHPDPSQPLARRWAWAVEQIADRRMERAWVAWSVPAPYSPGPTWITDAQGSGRVSINRHFGAPADQTVMLFTVARDGQVEHVAGHNAEVALGRQPVVWLGAAADGESFGQLRGMGDGLRDPDQRESLVEVVGLHGAAGVVPYLAAVLGRDGSNGVRREAAFALGRHATDESLAALRTAVRRDGSQDVRREAVEAIGRMRHPQSATVLQQISATAPAADTRRDAAEALGGAETAEAFQALQRIALSEPSQTVAKEAVEAMAKYPADQAAPALVDIAWRRGGGMAARQAAESLGALPAPWTVEALDSIARTHPDRAVAIQAVESLGGYRGVISEGYLTIIARTHRDPRVRDEATDQLARFRRGGDGIDPDFEPETEPDPEF